MFNLEEELKKLPAKPGVYIMHDKWDNIIYIGKAKILKNRVRQYFQSSRNKLKVGTYRGCQLMAAPFSSFKERKIYDNINIL